jgi:hypothetical protein
MIGERCRITRKRRIAGGSRAGQKPFSLRTYWRFRTDVEGIRTSNRAPAKSERDAWALWAKSPVRRLIHYCLCSGWNGPQTSPSLVATLNHDIGDLLISTSGLNEALVFVMAAGPHLCTNNLLPVVGALA